jgi:hypothetical protein
MKRYPEASGPEASGPEASGPRSGQPEAGSRGPAAQIQPRPIRYHMWLNQSW